jgi:hypothetical protein
MIKKYVMLFFIGSVIYSSSALAFHHTKFPYQNHIKKLGASSSPINNSFIGIWTGSCDTGGNQGESKWKVDISQNGIQITEDGDIIETGRLNEISAGTNSGSFDGITQFYIQKINKIRLSPENNLILDSVFIDADQNSIIPKSFSIFSDTYTFSLNKNQLIVDGITKIKTSLEENESISDMRCVLNKSA